MFCLDQTLPTPAENLACEEALAEACEAGGPEVLRFWEPARPFVVLGYGNQRVTEVNLPACAADGIPVGRRTSGGGTVLQMAGCLNYALVLRAEASGPLANVTSANRFIMEKNAAALSRLAGVPVSVRGHTDLAIGERKFSGNAQRRLRRTVLFHGCLLLSAELALMARYLRFPSKQPDYRQGRPHQEFVMNLNLPAAAVKAALKEAWQAKEGLSGVPWERIRFLAETKYSQPEWNERF
jgi:lipoate-protein ligase A